MSDRAKSIGLPPRPFLYTLDQIATILNVERGSVRNYLHYQGRSVGSHKRHDMKAVNIAGPDEKPEWRVSEGELVRWMKMKGLRYYERGYLDDGPIKTRDPDEMPDVPIGDGSWD